MLAYAYQGRVLTVILAGSRSSEDTVSRIGPFFPGTALMMTSIKPLNAGRVVSAKAMWQVGSPLSVATIVPCPVRLHRMTGWAVGTVRPCLSRTLTVTNISS